MTTPYEQGYADALHSLEFGPVQTSYGMPSPRTRNAMTLLGALLGFHAPLIQGPPSNRRWPYHIGGALVGGVLGRGIGAFLEKESSLKTAVSPELAKAVLIAKGVGLAMDDLVRASGPKRTIEQILSPLRKYKRTIRRAGPEARRHIFGPPQVEEPVRWANVAWKPDAVTAGKMHVHRMLGIS